MLDAGDAVGPLGSAFVCLPRGRAGQLRHPAGIAHAGIDFHLRRVVLLGNRLQDPFDDGALHRFVDGEDQLRPVAGEEQGRHREARRFQVLVVAMDGRVHCRLGLGIGRVGVLRPHGVEVHQEVRPAGDVLVAHQGVDLRGRVDAVEVMPNGNGRGPFGHLRGVVGRRLHVGEPLAPGPFGAVLLAVAVADFDDLARLVVQLQCARISSRSIIRAAFSAAVLGRNRPSAKGERPGWTFGGGGVRYYSRTRDSACAWEAMGYAVHSGCPRTVPGSKWHGGTGVKCLCIVRVTSSCPPCPQKGHVPAVPFFSLICLLKKKKITIVPPGLSGDSSDVTCYGVGS